MGCNRNMRRVYLLVALIATLSACRYTIHDHFPRPRVPVQDSDATPPSPPATEVARDVTTPPPPPGSNDTVRPAVQDPAPPDIITINSRLQDAFFPYDRADLTDAASVALANDAQVLASALRTFSHAKIIVEGHCDERGSAEYNLALGDTRAQRAAAALQKLGLPPAVLETVSYGKENPQCTESTESCWQKNRRAHIVVR